MKLLLAVLLLSPFLAVAQPYAGVTAGYGVTEDYRPKSIRQPHLVEDQKTTSATGGLFLGYRWGAVGFEGGLVTLPRMEGTSSTDNYWAYKGAPVGSYPKTISLNQTIRGESIYARVNLFGPSFFGFSPYAFLGTAYTLTRNHEWGIYDGKDEVSYRATYSTQRPIFGFGLQSPGRVFGRLEYVQINRASDEYHVRVRDVKMLLAGIGYRW